jgi:hypothetical protein
MFAASDRIQALGPGPGSAGSDRRHRPASIGSDERWSPAEVGDLLTHRGQVRSGKNHHLDRPAAQHRPGPENPLMTSTPDAIRPAGPSPHHQPAARPASPAADAAARVIGVLRDHPCWSVFWDKAYGVWRAADDDPDSGLYAESSDVGTVIGYIQAHA